MFKNMMKYKAWDKFCEWIRNKYNIHGAFRITDIECRNCGELEYYEFPCDLILNLIPSFMDEQKIYIDIDVNCNPAFIDKRFQSYVNKKIIKGWFANRQKALIKACEKAFDIMEGQDAIS